MLGFTSPELKILKRLSTPRKIQDFLNALKINFEEQGETCMSPHRVLATGKAHCMEGAMFGALALRMHDHKPLVIDLKSAKGSGDLDHVVAVFRIHGHWGAISKTNHPVLRYREPIYKSIRELVMSYFHEYFLDSGKKTLRSYSMPVDLSRFDAKGWMTAEKDTFYIPHHLARVPHIPILTPAMIRRLRRADKIEIVATKMTEWGKPRH